MRKLITTLCIIGVLMPISSFAQYRGNLDDGLIARYLFNADLQDASGNQNHGASVGTIVPTKDRFNNSCGAMYFDGNVFARVASSPSLESPNLGLTISAWFKLERGCEYGNIKWATICCKSDISTENDWSPQYRLQPTEWTTSLNTEITEMVKRDFDYDTWYFYAMTYDGSYIKTWLDNEKIFEFYYDNPLESNKFPLEIGRDLPGNLEFMHGSLDDLRIYNRALSEAEVGALFFDTSDNIVGYNPCGTAVPREEREEEIREERTDPVFEARPDTIKNSVIIYDTIRQPVKIREPRKEVVTVYDTVRRPVVIYDTIRQPVRQPVREQDFTREPTMSTEFEQTNNIVLLLDISASMHGKTRLPVLREAFLKMIPYFKRADRISLVTFSRRSHVMLEGVSGSEKSRIEDRIGTLPRGIGSTNAKEGLETAFRLATENFIPEGNNRIIMASDGDFPIKSLYKMGKKIAEEEIVLDIFAFGQTSEQKLSQLDELAQKANGGFREASAENMEQIMYEALKGIKR